MKFSTVLPSLSNYTDSPFIPFVMFFSSVSTFSGSVCAGHVRAERSCFLLNFLVLFLPRVHSIYICSDSHDDLVSLKHPCRPSPIAYGLTVSCSLIVSRLLSLSSQASCKVLELTVVFISLVCTTSPRTALASGCMKLIILPFIYVLWQKSKNTVQFKFKQCIETTT